MIYSVFIFLLVLSALVFFHELGHFLAAKACGIYVKRFSVGMPPRLFGVQIGETDYCIGALPFGGFVMMAGQEDVPLTEEEREEQYGAIPPERWFRNRPVWQRILVLVMGPLMNLILAVVIYGLVALAGAEVPEWDMQARVGSVVPDSPALTAKLHRMDGDAAPDLSAPPDAEGFQVGDEIVLVDGRPIENLTDLAAVAILGGPGREHDIVVERETAPGTVERLFTRLAPEIAEDEEHPRFGVGPFDTAKVGYVQEGSPAARAGLREGDIIHRADGRVVSRDSFIALMEGIPEGSTAVLDVERDGGTTKVEVFPETIGRVLGMFAAAPPAEEEGAPQPPEVLSVTDDLRERTGLRPRDRIVKVNGEPATGEKLAEIERNSPGGEMVLEVARPAVLMGLLEDAQTLTVTMPVDAVRAIGVGFSTVFVLRKYSPGQAAVQAFKDSYLAVERTVLTLKGLFARDVRMKDLGGPLMIWDVTTKAAEAGWNWLLRTTAFISVNLFIFNLLPLPVLDGGQIVTNTIESIRRKPLNDRFLERFQQVGLFLVLALMIFVTYNDIVRKVQEWIP